MLNKNIIFSGLLSLFSSFPLLAQVYTPQEALQDLASEKLTFVGRDYPNAALGAGGNYVCVYKNSKVYVWHDGCRPSHTMPLIAFQVKIASRSGGLVELYQEHPRENYRINEAGPNFNGTWKVTSFATPPIQGEPGVKAVINLDRNIWGVESEFCSIGKAYVYPNRVPRLNCSGSANDPHGELERFFNDPHSYGLKEAHDIILKAPRK